MFNNINHRKLQSSQLLTIVGITRNMFHVGGDIVNRCHHVSRHFLAHKVPADVQFDIGHRISERQAQDRHAITLGHKVAWVDGGRLIES